MKPYALTLLLVGSCILASAQSYIDSILNNLRLDNPVVLSQQLYRLEDHGYLAKVNPDRSTWPALATQYAEKAIEKGRTLDRISMIRIFAHQAEVLSRSHAAPRGYALINEARMIAEKYESSMRNYVYFKYSDFFKHLERYDSAIYFAEKALDLANEMKSDSIEKSCLEQVAGLCYDVKNNSKAELYFKKLVFHPLANDYQRRNYFNTIGLTFRRRAMYDSAIVYFQKSLEFAERDTAWLGLLNGNIGYTYFLNKQYDRALQGLLIDVDYSFRAHSYSSAMSALVTVTSIHILRKDMAKARLYYDSLSNRVIKFNNRETVLEYLKVSADYYEARGDWNRSHEFLESYINLNDSLQALQNSRAAAELDAKFAFERQVKKIETLEMQGKLQADESRLKTYFLIGTSIFILLCLCLIYVMFRSNRFKNETNVLLQEQNRQITEQAQRLNELNTTKDKLFSIISHDLRGPINSLKGLLGMVDKKMVTPEEFAGFSGKLQHSVEHVHFMLDNLLQWSKSQLQGMQTRPSLLSLRDLVQENFNLVQEQAKAKGITLENRVSPGATAFADGDQIRLVIRNLVSNAVKFTSPNGSITAAHSNDDKNATTRIHNTGSAISNAVMEKLFQVDASYTSMGTEGEKGTGLGLSLCKEMVEKNHGKIWVESSDEAGTAFFFALPTTGK